MATHHIAAPQPPATIGIVVPCFNEAEALGQTAAKLTETLQALRRAGKATVASKIYFVDDGSADGTWALIEHLGSIDPTIGGIKLSRNMGHQSALLAGLLTAEGDALISMDADLQDDVSVVGKMIDAFLAGDDIVYGVRSERRTDTLFKRFTAERFYWLMRVLGVDIVANHADFRLLSRRALNALREFKEVNLFLRALVKLTGFKHSRVYYERGRRVAGTSKYPLAKMLAFALNGITSFSAVPLRLISCLGLAICGFSFVMSASVVYTKLFVSGAVPGWASTVLPIYFIGGIQILCTGVIGEYLAKVYLETKQRPRFIIERLAGAAASAQGSHIHADEQPAVSDGVTLGYRLTRV